MSDSESRRSAVGANGVRTSLSQMYTEQRGGRKETKKTNLGMSDRWVREHEEKKTNKRKRGGAQE